MVEKGTYFYTHEIQSSIPIPIPLYRPQDILQTFYFFQTLLTPFQVNWIGHSEIRESGESNPRKNISKRKEFFLKFLTCEGLNRGGGFLYFLISEWNMA
jgi:hypothetical protein